jgi:hypothetical protein
VAAVCNRQADQFADLDKMIPEQTNSQLSGSGQNARATWRGHPARRQNRTPSTLKTESNPSLLSEFICG